jgi:hypothetical protein
VFGSVSDTSEKLEATSAKRQKAQLVLLTVVDVVPLNLQALEEAIRKAHGCDSERIKSVPVTEEFEGKVAWKGTVEVFRLIDHPEADYAYAWSYRDGKIRRCVTVLKLPPVDSPQSAVKVAIAAKGRQQRS